LVGVLSNAIPYGLDQVVLRRATPAQFALLLAILPAVAAVFGAVVLGQIPTAVEVFGIGLVISAIAVREREADDVEVATGAD
jgi:inner membrane transporter RhtA